VKSVINKYLSETQTEDEIKRRFKADMTAYLGCREVVPVVNGTVALEVALRGLGLSRGDFVIVPDISFVATATAVANCGLVPVYADVSSAYFGLTLEALRSRYSPRVRAAILVHFSGFVNRELFEIIEYCYRNDIFLVEDCAQAFSCTAHGMKVGTLGNAGTFSFQSSKIITAGEGGLIATNDPRLSAQFQAVSDWGLSPNLEKRRVDLASSNFRLSALQCYVLGNRLKDIDRVVAARRAYCDELEDACRRLGVEHRLPDPNTVFFDCPFFFPVTSGTQRNTVEPREESPLHRGAIVPAILKRFYPDLLEDYCNANPREITDGFCSNSIIADIDFINIAQVQGMPADRIITAYGEDASCRK